MTAPSLMFEHTLNAVKGWFSPSALDFSTKLSANVMIDPVYEGSVVHLNADSEFEMGVAGNQMAMFLIQDSTDPDATTPSVEGTDEVALTALVATGGYELQSTEYNAARTYAPNDLLTAVASNTVAATGGVLDNRNASNAVLTPPWVPAGTTRAICGVVSRGVKDNSHGQNALCFWPVWLPGAT
jgi:hypothetical protein